MHSFSKGGQSFAKSHVSMFGQISNVKNIFILFQKYFFFNLEMFGKLFWGKNIFEKEAESISNK